MDNINFNKRLNYLGYKGINLDNIRVSTYKQSIKEIPNDSTIENILSNTDTISLNEVKNLANKFYTKYFSLNNILYISKEQLSKQMPYISKVRTVRELYDNVNKRLKSINPMDIDIKLELGHSMVGDINKPILIPTNYNELEILVDNRKVYFSDIKLGNKLSPISAATLVHEVAHAEQEQNIGYTDDFLNKEIISIFLEKVAILEIDPTGELLKKSELARFYDASIHYNNWISRRVQFNIEEDAFDLMYIKSTFYAEKLFDMYLESTESERDKFFYQIQNVFDGKIKVEDFIRNMNVTLDSTRDITLVKKHI